jgi:dipeptidyl aminopeptidase/acylaminoacyl peptidase
VFAAQPLANRDIAVLQMEDKGIENIVRTPAEAEMYMAGYEAAVETLTASKLVDRDKIGLAGFSRTGWYVEYALTHSKMHYAAAVVCSNTDPSYMWSAALGWSAEASEDIGEIPFGDGLRVWLERSPGFNADKIHTPLQLQSDGYGLPSIAMYWEMFSRLRYLRRPVELYMVPDVEHGSHAMQNPGQLLASQQRAVDWFDFWLNGHENQTPMDPNQYPAWRKLRTLQIASAITH